MNPKARSQRILPLLPISLMIALSGCQTTDTGQTTKMLTGAPPEAFKKTIQVEPFSSERAPLAQSLQEGGFASEPAFVDEFNPDWNESQTAWQIGTWVQNGTQMARDRALANQEGQLVQTVLAGHPYRGGTMQSIKEFGYGRWLARLKPSKVPGLLNSMFTKDWDDKTTSAADDGLKAEVDFEFLTYTFAKGRGQVHIAIHLLNHSPLWHADIDLDFNPSDDYNIWGFDILPDRVVWHINGRVLYTWMYTDEYYVDPGYEMMFNSWTRDIWIKGPPREDGQYHIDWVKFFPLEIEQSE